MMRSITAGIVTAAMWLLGNATVYLFCIWVVGDPMLGYADPLGAIKAFVEGTLSVLFIWAGLSAVGLFDKFHKMIHGLLWCVVALLILSMMIVDQYLWRLAAMTLELAPFIVAYRHVKRPMGRRLSAV